MEFLVTLRQDWAALRGLEQLEALVAAERVTGRALQAEGHLVRIWRLPGQHANVGIWRVRDATELHATLQRLPLWPWLEADVVALARHALEGPCG